MSIRVGGSGGGGGAGPTGPQGAQGSAGSATTVTVSTKTADYTAVLGDANSVIRMNSASATVFTVPPNSSVAFPVGTIIEVIRTGAGTVTIAAGGGVTINKTASVLTIASQYGSASLLQVAADIWNLTGGLG